MRENLGEVMHKKYTAHKIREMEAIVASGDIGSMTRENVALMLKQAAAMREALEQAKRVLHCAIVSDILKGEDARKAFNAVTAALSAQQRQRNCDVGTPEEQSARFDAQCRKYMGCLACPFRSKYGGVHNLCEFVWSQMPYEEGETNEICHLL